MLEDLSNLLLCRCIHFERTTTRPERVMLDVCGGKSQCPLPSVYDGEICGGVSVCLDPCSASMEQVDVRTSRSAKMMFL